MKYNPRLSRERWESSRPRTACSCFDRPLPTSVDAIENRVHRMIEHRHISYAPGPANWNGPGAEERYREWFEEMMNYGAAR